MALVAAAGQVMAQLVRGDDVEATLSDLVVRARRLDDPGTCALALALRAADAGNRVDGEQLPAAVELTDQLYDRASALAPLCPYLLYRAADADLYDAKSRRRTLG